MACLFHCRTRSRALSSKHHLPRLFVADQGIVLDRCALIRVKHVFKRISIGVSHRLRMLQDRVVESLVIYTWGPSPRSADGIVPNSTGRFRRHRPFKESIRDLLRRSSCCTKLPAPCAIDRDGVESIFGFATVANAAVTATTTCTRSTVSSGSGSDSLE